MKLKSEKGFNLCSFCQDVYSIKGVKLFEAAEILTPKIRETNKNLWDFTTKEYIAPIIDEIKAKYEPINATAQALKALNCAAIIRKKKSRAGKKLP